MKTLSWLVIIALVLISCEKADSSSYSLNGRYIGFFSRTGMDTAQVSLLFSGDRFEGESDMTNYPAICTGEFELDNNSVNFNDACAWTANFDWSLILSGNYNINVSNGTVRIWKTSGAVTDEFLLRQPAR